MAAALETDLRRRRARDNTMGTVWTVRVSCSNGPTVEAPKARMASGANAANSAACLRMLASFSVVTDRGGDEPAFPTPSVAFDGAPPSRPFRPRGRGLSRDPIDAERQYQGAGRRTRDDTGRPQQATRRLHAGWDRNGGARSQNR